jgi:hypothetical protein
VIFSEFQGVVTPEDIVAQLERFKTDPAFQPSFNHLIDTRNATRFDPSGEGMRKVSMHTVFNEKSRRAIVADKDDMFGIARMYQLLREAHKAPDQIKVFRDMAEARRWLGLD